MKKAANLKRRLAELRDEPESPVEVILSLDADLYPVLKQLAAEEMLSPESYILRLLRSQVEMALTQEKRDKTGKTTSCPNRDDPV